nr:hypothetical protein [uncultured Blautia sp.]
MNLHKLIKASPLSPDFSEKEFEIDLPGKCPLCDTAYGEIPLKNYYISDYSEEFLYSLFFCPHCHQCFIVKYSVFSVSCNFPDNGVIDSIYPKSLHTTDFPEQIKQLSPQFVKIYHQSELAETAGLTEICGIGYRKALEFLIKDYAIHKNPNACDAIKVKPLAQCIEQYITADSITTLAKRSAWIGNDETHYVRIHETLDFTDMKSFIEAAQYFISMDLVVEKAASISPK